MSKKNKEEKERQISIYDPFSDAFREVPESIAIKFVESAKEVKKSLEEK